MTLFETLWAALADTHIVTKQTDIDRIRSAVTNYKAHECPFLKFIPPAEASQDEYDFRSESAFVITKVSKSETGDAASLDDREPSRVEPRQVRHIRRVPGRSIHIPVHRIEVPWKIPFLNEYFRNESTLLRIADELPQIMGAAFRAELEVHLMRPLIASAVHQVRFHEVDALEAKPLVVEIANSIPGPSSVLVNQADLNKFVDHIRPPFDLGFDIGERGKVRHTKAIGEGTILVVADQPDAVGLVREKTMPETFTYVKDVSDAICAAVGLYGFCVWGDAPVTGLEIRVKG